MAAKVDWCCLLLQAAEVVESQARDVEHGYASISGFSSHHQKKYTHNQLEKSRRASMRKYFERLKEQVPLAPNASKCTTLGVLKQSRLLIRNLESQSKKHLTERDTESRRQRQLLQRLEALTVGQYRTRDESSPVSTISTSSEQDDVDVTGSILEDEDQSNGSSDGTGNYQVASWEQLRGL